MLFDENNHSLYQNCQLKEVICQLRFPVIDSINEGTPSEFQLAIRESFPQYQIQTLNPPPRLVGAGTPGAKLQQDDPVIHHIFTSSTGIWKVILMPNSLALSTMRYNGWDDLIQRLAHPLNEFTRIYHPDFFERLSVRYLNIFSRASLGLELTPWRELFSPVYLSVLANPEVNENQVGKSTIDLQMKGPDREVLKVHAGPGRITQNGQPSLETQFILDIDVSILGQFIDQNITQTLPKLHTCAKRTFCEAITDKLHSAMEPTAL